MRTIIAVILLIIIEIVLGAWIIIDQGVTIRRERVPRQSFDGLRTGARAIRQAQDDLITIQEAYIAELERRLANKYHRDVTVTAYTARARECDADPGHTAMMTTPVPGRTIAVSRDLFNAGWTFGRSVYIAGFGVFVIEDLMAERHQERIDILVGSVRDARRIGRDNRRAVLIAGT